MGRKRKSELPECDHFPILKVQVGTKRRFYSVECVRCRATTGYGLDRQEAWDRWRNGDVIVPPADVLEEE